MAKAAVPERALSTAPTAAPLARVVASQESSLREVSRLR
jgi:hypothetical protein